MGSRTWHPWVAKPPWRSASPRLQQEEGGKGVVVARGTVGDGGTCSGVAKSGENKGKRR